MGFLSTSINVKIFSSRKSNHLRYKAKKGFLFRIRIKRGGRKKPVVIGIVNGKTKS